MKVQHKHSPLPVGRRLKARREQLGLTQQALAEQVHMRQNIISRLEHDDTPSPGADVLLRLARALHCSIDWLVGLYDEPPAPVRAPEPEPDPELEPVTS